MCLNVQLWSRCIASKRTVRIADSSSGTITVFLQHSLATFARKSVYP